MNTISTLVAVADYSSDKRVVLFYVHTRNVYYQRNGIKVTVLSFAAEEEYTLDGIRVIPLSVYEKEDINYDVLICHAANIRNHYRFLRKYGGRFPRFVFFFHGHEVMKINKSYCAPYPWMKKSRIKAFLQDRYDDFKLFVWRKYYPSVLSKTSYVFVSKWMLEEFLKWTKIPFGLIEEKTIITYNCIGKAFEETVYDFKGEKKYDFLTIRSCLDDAKYSIDIVNSIAKNNPSFRFLLVGRGKYFEHDAKAPNIEWLNRTMNHDEIVECIQQSRCALMPTRTDAQGLMMCEMASTGMPLITSNIPVCHEVFNTFRNVAYINNETLTIDLKEVLEELESREPYDKNNKYYNDNTSQQEVRLLKTICSDIRE